MITFSPVNKFSPTDELRSMDAVSVGLDSSVGVFFYKEKSNALRYAIDPQ
jgi:hypothetical protein